MNTHVVRQDTTGLAIRVSSRARTHLAWLAAGLAGAFAIPFVFADMLELQRDLYYAVYIVSVAAFFSLWVRTTGLSLTSMIRRRWLLCIGLTLAASALLMAVVLGKDATPRPDGFALMGAVVWRGLAYGLADGLLLSAFPILAVFAMFEGTRVRKRMIGTIAVGLAALLASMAMTATYHLGYSDFRSEKVRQPLAGDVVWSAPTLLTLNPIGAPLTHAAMHITAVLHSYETDVFLPPHE
jgi:hypothetical protein